mmetsp:Transcript_6044/g.17814  ORF Transcript_6044/g.17814 Transcript_6044/m.17814 type:complete len:222 (-) Transcript_6044:796-1461(-)
MSSFFAIPLSDMQPSRNSVKLTWPDMSSSRKMKSEFASEVSRPRLSIMALTSSSSSRWKNSSLVSMPEWSSSILMKASFKIFSASDLSSFSRVMTATRSFAAACMAALQKIPVRMLITPKTMVLMNTIQRNVKIHEMRARGSATSAHSEPPEIELKSVSIAMPTLPYNLLTCCVGESDSQSTENMGNSLLYPGVPSQVLAASAAQCSRLAVFFCSSNMVSK